MASQDEINDPLWELMQLYFMLNNFPPLNDGIFDQLVSWVQTNLNCEYSLALKIVNSRFYKRSQLFGTGWVFEKSIILEPDEELAYQRWMATKNE